jgi:hypothetical protein
VSWDILNDDVIDTAEKQKVLTVGGSPWLFL